MSEDPLKNESQRRKLRAAAKSIGKKTLVGTASLLSAATMAGGSQENIKTPGHSLTSGKTALKNSMEKTAASHYEHLTGRITERERRMVQQATVRVIAWNKDYSAGEEGTGFVVRYGSSDVVMTAAHTFVNITGRANGLGPKGAKPVDYALSPRAKDFHFVIADVRNQSTILAEANGLSIGDQDTALLSLDETTKTVGYRQIKPLPASSFITSPPKPNTPVTMYGMSQAYNKPIASDGVYKGMVTLPWEHRQVAAIMLTAPSLDKDPCYTWGSGETAVSSGGTFWPDESRRINIGYGPNHKMAPNDATYIAAKADWDTVVSQLDADAHSSKYRTICLMEPPRQSLLGDLVMGLGRAPGS